MILLRKSQKATTYGTFAVIAIVASLFIGILPIPIILAGSILFFVAPILMSSPHVLMTILLVLAPLRTLVATESNLALPFDIGQIILIIYLGTWIAFHIYRGTKFTALYFSIIFKIIALVTIVFGFNIWSSTSINSWLTEWLKWCVIALLVWQIDIFEQNTWHWLIFAFLTSAFANALVGLYIFFGGSGADHLVILGRFFRAFGTFGQPNPFGGFMGIALPIAIMCTYSQLNALWSNVRHQTSILRINFVYLLISFVTTLVLLSGLIASWSRGAWLGFAISTTVMVFAIPRKLSISLAVSTFLVITIAGLLIGGVIPQSIVNRITTAATDFITIDEIRGVDITTINYAVVERIAHWQAAINMAEANPILGVGLGNYEIIYDNYRLLNWKEPLGHAHNYYLNILAETGIIGFLVYFSFWIVVFITTWQIRQHPDQFTRSIGIGLLGTWTYLSVHSLFDNLYVNNLFLHLGVLLGILAVLHRQVEQTVTLE